MAEVKYKWGEWKKVDLTDSPFYLSWDETSLSAYDDEEKFVPNLKAEYSSSQKILLDILSLSFKGTDLEYFDAETDPTPRIPEELKIYCPIDAHNSEFWPQEIGNTKEHPYDWSTWFYLNSYISFPLSVKGLQNCKKNMDDWFMLTFEGLSPIFIRPITKYNKIKEYLSAKNRAFTIRGNAN
jgi:hypothetical protein